MQTRRIVPFLLVVFAAVLVMGGCSGKQQEDAKKASQTAAAPKAEQGAAEPDRSNWPVIVAFGDSLTAGQGVPVERSYPARLQAELEREGYRYRVVNAGVSGDTTGGGLGRLESVLRHKPEIVILELGANDGLRGQPVATMKQNLTGIIERLRSEGVKVVLAGMQIPPNYGPDYTEGFQRVFTELAERYQLPLIPFFLDGVAARPELNQADGIHPTAQGYIEVIKNVMPALEPLLRKGDG